MRMARTLVACWLIATLGCGGSAETNVPVTSDGGGTGGAGDSGGRDASSGSDASADTRLDTGTGGVAGQSGAAGQAGASGQAGGAGASCTYEGQTYEPGKMFAAGTGCDQCICSDGGLVACTSGCVRPTCEYGGVKHDVGTVWHVGDGCNTCSGWLGGGDGAVVCTSLDCAAAECFAFGEEFQVGETYLDSDVVCACMAGGQFACAQSNLPSYGACVYDGTSYVDGAEIEHPDGCNVCACEMGKWSCAGTGCQPAGCDDAGVFVPFGKYQVRSSGGSCELCRCEADFVCTPTSCEPVECENDGNFFAIGTPMTDDIGCNSCTCIAASQEIAPDQYEVIAAYSCSAVACGCQGVPGTPFLPHKDDCNVCVCDGTSEYCTDIDCDP